MEEAVDQVYELAIESIKFDTNIVMKSINTGTVREFTVKIGKVFQTKEIRDSIKSLVNRFPVIYSSQRPVLIYSWADRMRRKTSFTEGEELAKLIIISEFIREAGRLHNIEACIYENIVHDFMDKNNF